MTKATGYQFDASWFNYGGIVKFLHTDNNGNLSPGWRIGGFKPGYKLRLPKDGRIALLSDGVIIQGGDMEYPARWGEGALQHVTVTTVSNYKNDQLIGGNLAIYVACKTADQDTYFPIIN